VKAIKGKYAFGAVIAVQVLLMNAADTRSVTAPDMAELVAEAPLNLACYACQEPPSCPTGMHRVIDVGLPWGVTGPEESDCVSDSCSGHGHTSCGLAAGVWERIILAWDARDYVELGRIANAVDQVQTNEQRGLLQVFDCAGHVVGQFDLAPLQPDALRQP